MTNRETIDAVFRKLTDAPVGVDCTNNQVLAALGMMTYAIMAVAFKDPTARQNEADRFCNTLPACIDVDPVRLAPSLN
jgi:hypothetical protein